MWVNVIATAYLYRLANRQPRYLWKPMDSFELST